MVHSAAVNILVNGTCGSSLLGNKSCVPRGLVKSPIACQYEETTCKASKHLFATCSRPPVADGQVEDRYKVKIDGCGKARKPLRSQIGQLTEIVAPRGICSESKARVAAVTVTSQIRVQGVDSGSTSVACPFEETVG